ncbi:Plant intracellular Ras-group- LRR protein 6 [Ancistrocladus abbreviatus]
MDRVLKSARTSGSLNLSNRSLREVPDEVYRNLDAEGEGDRWWEAVDLQKLILAHNDIEVLKEDLKNLPLLSVLNISHNKLTQLPAAIGELALLKSLDLSFNSIANLPEEIGSATSLVKIYCSNNQIAELPRSLGKCMELSELKAANNFITSLPEDLANCSKLLQVDLEGNKMIELSENVLASWTMLKEFNASKNLLNSIPGSIGRLSRLIRLDLHQNRISSIPSSIKGCSSLVEFYVGNNVLVSLPVELGELPHLGILDLHSNQLKEYPAEACKLQLSVLDLSNNSLSGLPAELGLMTNLRKLVLTGNPLRTIRSTLVTGPTVALLKYLRSRLPSAEEDEASTPKKDDVVAMAARLSIISKELSLGGMGLSAVPSEAWESSEIMKLDLSKNSIEELPIELSSCTSLQVLILSRNKIRDWPSVVLKSLPNLLCLKLDNNPLREIPVNGFEGMLQLQILDLSGCSASLPDHPGFLNLPHLQELYLRRMQLCEVPSDIFCLQHLQILDLSQNSLRSITEGLLEPSLQALRIDGNPLRSIRRTILDRGTKAVLKYLKDKL